MRSVSLFTGCGGLDLGLTRAGFDVALGVELEETFADSYIKNFPDTPMFRGRVEDVTLAEMNSLAGQSIQQIDLLAGGPPCPPFSKSRFYRKDAPRALADPVA